MKRAFPESTRRRVCLVACWVLAAGCSPPSEAEPDPVSRAAPAAQSDSSQNDTAGKDGTELHLDGTETADPASDALLALTDGGADASRSTYFESIDLGEVAFSVSGISEEMFFEAPRNAVSITFVLVGVGGVYYGLDQLQVNEGPYLVKPNWYIHPDPNPETGTFRGVCEEGCPLRISLHEQAFAVTVPNAPQLQYEAGTYRFRFYGIAPLDHTGGLGPATARVIVKKASPPPGPGSLDLHLHFTGAGDITASTALSTPWFDEGIEELRTKLATVDIEIGSISVKDAPTSLSKIESTVGADSDLSQLFATTEADGGTGLHVFFVDEISDGDDSGGPFGMILGISGGIPGPPMTPGTHRSGVAVVINNFYLRLLGGSLGGVIAHEAGHFLGLYHSTTSNGSSDAIPDTETGDTSNLMYWTETGEGNVLTPGQGEAMKRNPMIQPL